MRRIAADSGFTLLEVLIALILGTFLIAGAGQLGLNIFHQRASYDSISAATSLAEKRFEILRDLQNPITTLVSGSATNLKEDGTSGGPFNVVWTVTNVLPSAVAGICPTPVSGPTVSGTKKVSIRVTHNNNPAIDVNLVTYYKVC